MDDPTDALEVLGHDLRLSILRELADANEALAFSELRRRVGVRDTGKFNYHLNRLCEYFVRESRDGYELGHAGQRVITAAAAGATGGSTSAPDRRESLAEPDECPVCGETDCEKWFHVHLDAPW